MIMPPGPHTSLSDEELTARLKTLLPETYQDSYETLQPVSMGSAGLLFGPDGRVAWDKIWGSFCNLAMAGGPPHRGTLLEPGSQADIDTAPGRYMQVLDELCRGVELVTGLSAEPSEHSGWLRVDCRSAGMAGWLTRAIVMENISVHQDGTALFLPAGPQFRLEKEIKNVITSIAKTCHYWQGHMQALQHRSIAALLTTADGGTPLIEPPFPVAADAAIPAAQLRVTLAEKLGLQTGRRAAERTYPGWAGFQVPHIAAAVWMMRMMVAGNVLCRREEAVVYLPLNPDTDPQSDRVAQLFTQVYRSALANQVL